jgi:hypothetical protein
MQKNIILVYCLILSYSAFSQENAVPLDKNSYLGISIGSSIPLNDFKSTEGKNTNAGFAKSGKKYDFFWGKDLKNCHWGVTALLRLHTNPIDKSALSAIAKTAYPSFEYNISSKDWKLCTLMAGAYYRIPVSRKMTLMPKAMIGIAYIDLPETNVVANNNVGNIATSFTESSHKVTPNYLFSLGLKSNLFKQIVLVSNFDILGAFPTFTDVKTTYGNGTLITRSKSPSFLTFNYGIGIGFKF